MQQAESKVWMKDSSHVWWCGFFGWNWMVTRQIPQTRDFAREHPNQWQLYQHRGQRPHQQGASWSSMLGDLSRFVNCAKLLILSDWNKSPVGVKDKKHVWCQKILDWAAQSGQYLRKCRCHSFFFIFKNLYLVEKGVKVWVQIWDFAKVF